MRRISYRHAFTAFFFTACWLIFGFLFLMTPLPDSLGVTGQMLAAWIVLFFVFMAASGAMLTLASINGIWPPVARPPRRTSSRLSSPSRTTAGTPSAHDASSQAWTRPLPPRSSGGR
jgi:hypothetical protein